MPEPNLYIIGTAKAATTALCNYLGRHPKVFLPDMKEPHFYSEGFPPPRQGILRHIDCAELYLRLYAGSTNQHDWRIDGSTSYLCSSNASRMLASKPNAKIIVCLRDPVDRFMSHYRVDWSEGFERRDLQSLLRELRPGECEPYNLFDYGRYGTHLQRWLGELNPANFLLVDFSALVQASESCMRAILDFLALPHEPGLAMSQENASYQPRNGIVAQLMRMSTLRQLLRSCMSAGLRAKLRDRVLFRRGKQLIANEDAVKEQLRLLYASEMAETKTLLPTCITVGEFKFLRQF